MAWKDPLANGEFGNVALQLKWVATTSHSWRVTSGGTAGNTTVERQHAAALAAPYSLSMKSSSALTLTAQMQTHSKSLTASLGFKDRQKTKSNAATAQQKHQSHMDALMTLLATTATRQTPTTDHARNSMSAASVVETAALALGAQTQMPTTTTPMHPSTMGLALS